MFINCASNILNNSKIFVVLFLRKSYFCPLCYWRGARVVMEQIANLSTGNRRQGSNPCLSAILIPKTF